MAAAITASFSFFVFFSDSSAMKKTQKRKKSLRPLPWWQVVGYVVICNVYTLVVCALMMGVPLALWGFLWWLVRLL